MRQVAAELGMPENTLAVRVSQARRGKGVFTPPQENDLFGEPTRP